MRLKRTLRVCHSQLVGTVAQNELRLRTIALGLCLMVLAPVGEARCEKAGIFRPEPSDLEITQVRRLQTSESAAFSEVEIRWTAQASRPATFDGFEAALKVRYSDGSRAEITSGPIKASSRSVILRVRNHSKPGGVGVLKEFKAAIRARVKHASSLWTSQEFDRGAHAVTNLFSDGRRPAVAITVAKVRTRGVIDVKWTATVPGSTGIDGFEVNVEALFKDGTKVTASKSVSSSRRQARLILDRANGSDIPAIKVSLLTNFFLIESRNAVREGSL